MTSFERAINLLRFKMICSTEKLDLLCKWIIFKKVDDPELKAFLKVFDNLEKAAAVLLPSDSTDGSLNEDLAAELHIDSIGLKESFNLVNEMKAKFEDLKTKLDLIVSCIIDNTLDDNELKEFLNLACQCETAPALVLLTDEIISKYLKEFEELKSKVELMKTKLNLICGWIIHKKDLELKGLLKYLCNQEKAAAAPDSLELVNDDISTFGRPNNEENSDSNGESTLKSPTSKNDEITHTREKNFSCDVCQKRFTRSHHLKDHKRIHTKEKPYTCNQCEAKFAQLATLRKHRQTHSAEKPHNYNLRDHLRIHTGEKPFGCPYCNQQFRYMSGLQYHQHKHITVSKSKILVGKRKHKL